MRNPCAVINKSEENQLYSKKNKLKQTWVTETVFLDIEEKVGLNLNSFKFLAAVMVKYAGYTLGNKVTGKLNRSFCRAHAKKLIDKINNDD